MGVTGMGRARPELRDKKQTAVPTLKDRRYRKVSPERSVSVDWTLQPFKLPCETVSVGLRTGGVAGSSTERWISS